jgi:protein-disulfide isomerase
LTRHIGLAGYPAIATIGCSSYLKPDFSSVTEFPLPITRREFCRSTAAIAFATAVLGASAISPFDVAFAQTVAEAEILKPGALPDMAIGDAKAPVTIVEYASMTCPHCAYFSETTFPELKKRYIDTGKVRFIMREFPLDPLAEAAFMLARCVAKDDAQKYVAMVDTLFRQQKTWAVQKPVPPLMTIMKQAGMNEKDFEACLSNQKLLENVQAVRQRAVDVLKVQSTPTFFINGKMTPGAVSIDDLAKQIDPYLKS